MNEQLSRNLSHATVLVTQIDDVLKELTQLHQSLALANERQRSSEVRQGYPEEMAETELSERVSLDPFTASVSRQPPTISVRIMRWCKGLFKGWTSLIFCVAVSILTAPLVYLFNDTTKGLSVLLAVIPVGLPVTIRFIKALKKKCARIIFWEILYVLVFVLLLMGFEFFGSKTRLGEVCALCAGTLAIALRIPGLSDGPS